MRHNVKKITKMLDELATFFLEHEAVELQTKVKYTKEITRIEMEAYGIPNIEDTIDRIKHALSNPRELEMEEYYWELAGEAETDEELALIGAMIDEAQVEYDTEKVIVQLLRNNER